jgi:hypothetical protein
MILLVDNYDSFTYNLAHYLSELGAEVTVRRPDELDDELSGRAAGTGGEDEVRGLELVVERVGALHGHLRAQLGQVVREVVGERVVVVDKQDHRALASASSIAVSSAASFRRHSSCSAAGSESATIPAPACSSATPSCRTIVRIAMQVSSVPSGSE